MKYPKNTAGVFLTQSQARGALNLRKPAWEDLREKEEGLVTDDGFVVLKTLLTKFPEIRKTLVLRTGQAAALLGVSPRTVRRLAERGQLENVRPVGVHRRFALADVLDIERVGEQSWNTQ